MLIIVLCTGVCDDGDSGAKMIKPLQALSNTAHEVTKGNLNVPQLSVVYDDEVGVVTRSFNQMLDSIRKNIAKLKESMEHQVQMKERELLMENHLKEAQLKYLRRSDQSAFPV